MTSERSKGITIYPPGKSSGRGSLVSDHQNLSEDFDENVRSFIEDIVGSTLDRIQIDEHQVSLGLSNGFWIVIFTSICFSNGINSKGFEKISVGDEKIQSVLSDIQGGAVSKCYFDRDKNMSIFLDENRLIKIIKEGGFEESFILYWNNMRDFLVVK